MKKLSLFIVALSMLLFSCSDTAEEIKESILPCLVTANISGSVTDINGDFCGRAKKTIDFQTDITGKKSFAAATVSNEAEGNLIGLSFPNKIGTFGIFPDTLTKVGENTNPATFIKGTETFQAKSGSISITKAENGVFSGTFSFVATKRDSTLSVTDSVVISNGAFTDLDLN